MAEQQIQRGVTYVNYGTPGQSQVTAQNLNKHVDDAVLLSGAISAQNPSTPLEADYVLAERSGQLFKYTIGAIKTLFSTLANGFLQISGGTMTGPLVLENSTPATDATATSKGYVDAQVATRLPAGGGTVSGTYLFSGNLQTSTAPTSANDVPNKGYVDALIPNFSASAYFNTATPTNSSVNTATFLTVLALRTAGSSTLTINYSSLDARYSDSTKPFFLANQYIGINSGISGITGRLYKITSANLTAKTFTVTTPETTAFNQTITLSLVYDSTNLPTVAYGKNVKSIYIDMSCVSKMYVNYINDVITNSSTAAGSTAIRNINIVGNANGYDANQLICIPMRNFGRTTNDFNQDAAEGFGAVSSGCHIGFFYNNANGSDYSSYYAISFSIISVIKP